MVISRRMSIRTPCSIFLSWVNLLLSPSRTLSIEECRNFAVHGKQWAKWCGRMPVRFDQAVGSPKDSTKARESTGATRCENADGRRSHPIRSTTSAHQSAGNPSYTNRRPHRNPFGWSHRSAAEDESTPPSDLKNPRFVQTGGGDTSQTL